MTRYIRCIEGHVYEADAHPACPQCGSVPPRATDTSTDTGANKTSRPDQQPLLTAGRMWIAAAVIAAVVGFALKDQLVTPHHDQHRNEHAVVDDATKSSETQIKNDSGGTENSSPVSKGAKPHEETKESPTSPRVPDGQDDKKTESGHSDGKAPGGENALVGEVMAALDRHDYREAWRLAEPLAQAGNPTAQFLRGKILHLGLGIQKSESEAAIWYRKAANQGEPRAMNNLAQLLLEGRGVPKDSAEPPGYFARQRKWGSRPHNTVSASSSRRARVCRPTQPRHFSGIKRRPNRATRKGNMASVA
jgi:hypothetical protein